MHVKTFHEKHKIDTQRLLAVFSFSNAAGGGIDCARRVDIVVTNNQRILGDNTIAQQLAP